MLMLTTVVIFLRGLGGVLCLRSRLMRGCRRCRRGLFLLIIRRPLIIATAMLSLLFRLLVATVIRLLFILLITLILFSHNDPPFL